MFNRFKNFMCCYHFRKYHRIDYSLFRVIEDLIEAIRESKHLPYGYHHTYEYWKVWRGSKDTSTML